MVQLDFQNYRNNFASWLVATQLDVNLYFEFFFFKKLLFDIKEGKEPFRLE